MSTNVAPRPPAAPLEVSPRTPPPSRWNGGDSGGGGGGGGWEGDPGRDQPFSNRRLGMLAVLILSTMFFSGFVGGFIVLRTSALQWPPEGSPPLPGLLRLSTAVLLLSSALLVCAHLASRREDVRWFRRALLGTTLSGLAFLVLQSVAWWQLMRSGFRLSSSNYGGSFYLITWAHGAHVLVGIVLLALLTARAHGSISWNRLRESTDVVAMFWHFVDLLWLALYALLSN
jgi:cytochrome c oxidase subunit 3